MRTLKMLFSTAGFYGRPWTMEQRKELFRRYEWPWTVSVTCLRVLRWYSDIKHCIKQATEMGIEHIPLCTQRWLQAQDVLERALLSRGSRWLQLHFFAQFVLRQNYKPRGENLSSDKSLFLHKFDSFHIYLVEQLMTLISAAKEHAIEFIYAISPGLDITFSNQKEVSALKRKLDQVL